ncbi:MAG: biopolymer transporter ExbD [Planctomycetes bacterium]|nr:biopolymer transporter ExbD [Planctomycetota bacterium]
MASRRKAADISAEADMTPMIDMTFQLIAFFMVLINFSEDNQNELVKLPSSELAKVPEAPVPMPIVLQVSRHGKVFFNGDELGVASKAMDQALRQEAQVLARKPGNPGPGAAHVIIRAHGLTRMGDVQQLIAVCQKHKFEKFALRAEAGKATTDTALKAYTDKQEANLQRAKAQGK